MRAPDDPRMPYIVTYWIENTGPYTRSVNLTVEEAEALEAKIVAAEHRGALHDWMLEALDTPLSYEQYLQEAEVLATPEPART